MNTPDHARSRTRARARRPARTRGDRRRAGHSQPSAARSTASAGGLQHTANSKPGGVAQDTSGDLGQVTAGQSPAALAGPGRRRPGENGAALVLPGFVLAAVPAAASCGAAREPAWPRYPGVRS